MWKIISIILLSWVTVGRAHQIWALYLKSIPLSKWIFVAWNHRFTILETGVLGYLTPYFHWKWNKTKPKRPSLKGDTLSKKIAA